MITWSFTRYLRSYKIILLAMMGSISLLISESLCPLTRHKRLFKVPA
jgi:hypothetical protein